MQYQWSWRVLQLGVLVFLPGCVTQTEIRPYQSYNDPYYDESVLDELKREFGWRKNKWGVMEAPYTRAARSVKETVSEWFSDDEMASGTPEGQQSLHQLKQDQEEANRRLQELQEQERLDDQ
jgi:hypothetical protein